MSKVVLILVFLSLAFGICINTTMTLEYDQRLTVLLVFLLASMADVIFLRPLLLFGQATLKYADFRLSVRTGKSKIVS